MRATIAQKIHIRIRRVLIQIRPVSHAPLETFLPREAIRKMIVVRTARRANSDRRDRANSVHLDPFAQSSTGIPKFLNVRMPPVQGAAPCIRLPKRAVTSSPPVSAMLATLASTGVIAVHAQPASSLLRWEQLPSTRAPTARQASTLLRWVPLPSTRAPAVRPASSLLRWVPLPRTPAPSAHETHFQTRRVLIQSRAV